jgi:beta-lactamase class A
VRHPWNAPYRRALLAGLIATGLAPPAAFGGGSPALTAHLAPKTIVFGASLNVSGALSGETLGNGNQPLDLKGKPYGASRFSTVATTSTATDGSYTFAVAPDRNTRYRVVTESAPVTRSPTLAATVTERVRQAIAYPPLGRARASFVSRHPTDLHWGGRTVYWFLAPRSSKSFSLVAKTRTTEATAGVTRFRAVFPVPAGPFRYVACFGAPGRRAMDGPPAHAPCHQQDYVASSQLGPYHGRGVGPVGFPGASRVARAGSYLAQRSGRTAFAVMDTEGRLHGLHVHHRFVCASVIKAMLLVAYLRELDLAHKGLDSNSRSTLHAMIHVSDNNAATAIWQRVGDPRLRALAHRAGMTDFSISGIWANGQISPADQARFFFEMDSLIPARFDGYARSLLAGITASQRWGIPHVARGWKVFFKGGWRPTSLGQLVHQIARLERPGGRISIAVMTDGDPTMGYGIATIEGVTRRLIG